VLERFLQDGAEFRPSILSWFAEQVNAVFSPLDQTAIIPPGVWARAAQGLQSEEYDEINIGVRAKKAQIHKAKIIIDVGLPEYGPRVVVPSLNKFKKLKEVWQFDINYRSMEWVNLLAENFAPDLLPRPPSSLN